MRTYTKTPWQVRFKAKVDERGKDECWPWKANSDKDGYGLLSVWGDAPVGERRAHRLAWILKHGPIPKGMRVLHTCDNPPCCNDRHLFLGTNADNTHDSMRKGRFVFGSKNGVAKLTEETVVLIRQLFKDGYCRKRLARKFDVSKSLIAQIIRRAAWRHI